MSKIGGSQILAKCLKKEGVRTVFTLSGGHTVSMYYACIDEGIEVVDCRSEADAVIAADAYAKATGGPGVVLTTAGPGVSNTYTGMLEAHTGRTPVVQIGGACQLELQGTGDMQDVDNVSLMKHCTKWAKKVYKTERIADFLDDAFRHAMSGLPGPVYLEIAVDVLMDAADADAVEITAGSRTRAIPYGDPEYIERAAALLASAEKPLLIVGNSARYSCEPRAAVQALAEYLDMPVLASTVGRGLFLDERHPLAKVGAAAAAEADVILTLCTPNDITLAKFKSPAYRNDAKFIMISPDALSIGFNRPAEIGIVGGAAPCAKQLLEAVSRISAPKKREAYLETLRKKADSARTAEEAKIFQEAELVRPARCAAEVVRFLEDEGLDYTVVADGGDAGCWINKLSCSHRPAQILGLIGNGSIGLAPGTAVGAWYGAKKPVLIYTGDGSFGYNFMEFSNYVHKKIPVIAVVSNDSAWGMVKGFEWVMRPNVYADYEASHGDQLATNLPFIHYEKLAQELGGYGELVERPEEIGPALRRAIASGKPAVINVRVEDITLGGFSPRTESLAKGFAAYARDFV